MNPVHRTIAASWPPVLVYVILVVSILLGDHGLSAQQYDQDIFHMQVVRKFDAIWPAIEMSNYGTATGPAYHYVMATAGQVIGTDVDRLRPVCSAFAAGSCRGTVVRGLSRR